MKKILANKFITPFAFLALCLIAYGLLIPWLGFYWDDFPYTWFARTLGPTGLIQALADDRPILAGIYMLTTSLLGDHPLTWQIFALLCRWLLVLVFWWALRQVWPKHYQPVTWAALLFAVYPGFQQHWISVIYSQAYVLMAAFIASLGLMIVAVRRQQRRWLFVTLALVLSAFCFFSTEYFFGVELVRPVFIWIVLAELGIQPRARWRATLQYWAPYLVELAFFVIWRAFLFNASTYEVQALTGGVLAIAIDFIRTTLANSFTGLWSAWAQAVGAPFSLDFSQKASQAYLLVAAAGLAVTAGFLFLLHRRGEDSPEPDTTVHWSLQAMLAGGVALLAASIPFWAAGLPFDLLFPYNRFTLAMMPGVSLLLAGLIGYLIRTPRQKIVLVSLLVTLAVGFQFLAANTYRREWDNLKDFFWQLTWRMPDIEPGTIILTHQFPFKYYSDNSLSAAVNWTYAPEFAGHEMPYMVNYTTVRLKKTLPSLKPNVKFEQDYRATTFQGNTSNSLVLFYSPPGCLRVLDKVYSNENALPGLNGQLVKALPLSNLDRIRTETETPAQPPADLFGQEQPENWCYYFEKADLARQQGDWESVAELGNQAIERSLSPGKSNELLVYIEGFARTGDLDQAQQLSATVDNDAKLIPGLCEIWKRVEAAS
ncbi:MAG TPA: hypothetical protein VHO48_10320, partial [Anaerolineaceae bacterium]|nr:hypothetical protein [Anaerolineaceae bacterium]